MNRAACLVFLLAVALPTAAQQNRIIASGSGSAIWLLRLDETQRFDLVVKGAGQRWQYVTSQQPNMPAAATAVDEQFHMLFADPLAYAAFNMAGESMIGRNPDDPQRWPSNIAPIAVCPASGLSAAAVRDILAVVPTARTAQSATLQIFQGNLGQWRYVTELPDVPLTGDDGVFAAARGGDVYLMIDAAERRNQLYRWNEERWFEVPLKGPAAESRILELLSIDEQLVLVPWGPVTDAPGRDIRIATIADAGSFVYQPVTLDDQPFVLPPESRIQAARFGDQVALIFSEHGRTKLATCQLNGRISSIETIGILQQPPLDGKGARILEYFMWAALIAIFIPLFLLRPRTAPRPFALPENVATANLLKRLVAGVADLMPFSLLSAAVFPLPPMPADQLWQLMKENRLPVNFTYASIAAIMAYIVYCIVMEKSFGATLAKMAFKMRVVGEDARRITLREAVIRNMVKIIELSWPMFVPLLLLMPLFTRYRQRLGDMLARTAVVEARSLPSSVERPPDDREADDEEIDCE